MITVSVRKKLKKVFNNRYSKEVQDLLKVKGVLGKKGLPHGIAYISHVFNGRNSDDDIELAILELYQKRRDEQSKNKIYRKQLLENKKPEAGTSGID
jgi:hypothetical protein